MDLVQVDVVGAQPRQGRVDLFQDRLAGQARAVRARVADPEERAALWPRPVELYADFESYQAWTDREIPVVVLEPR